MAYAPPGLSRSELFQEKQVFLMTVFHALGYGVHVSIGATTLYFAFRTPSSGKTSWLLVAFIIALLVCGTIQAATTIQAGIMMFIENRNFPGGPMAYFVQEYSDPVETAGNAAYVFANLLADGVLLYRLYVVWAGNLLVLIIPSLAYMATIALSILSLYQSAKPGASLWTQSAIDVLLPYWSLGVSNNALITLLIVYRMLSVRHSMLKALGSHHLGLYVSISAMLIESAALYSIVGIVFIALYATNSPVQNPVLAVMDQVICIAPELIVMRVVLGRAWSKETITTMTMAYKPGKSHQPVQVTSILVPTTNGSDTFAINASDSALGETHKLSEMRTGEQSV